MFPDNYAIFHHPKLHPKRFSRVPLEYYKSILANDTGHVCNHYRCLPVFPSFTARSIFDRRKFQFDRFIRKICYRFVENINRSPTIHTGYNDITTRFRITVLTRRRWSPFPTFSTRMIYDRREEYRIARLLQLPVYFTIIPPLPRSAGYIRPSHEYAVSWLSIPSLLHLPSLNYERATYQSPCNDLPCSVQKFRSIENFFSSNFRIVESRWWINHRIILTNLNNNNNGSFLDVSYSSSSKCRNRYWYR